MYYEIKFCVVGFRIVIIILQINDWMLQMVMFYLDLVIVEFIGLIWEGCEIKMMKVLIINVFVFVVLLFLLVKV